MVSSTERMRQVASDAAPKALILTRDGSQTHFSMLSITSSFKMSTPIQRWPVEFPNCNLSILSKCIKYTESCLTTLCVFLAQFVQNIGRIKAGIVAKLARNHFESLCDGANEHLLLASDRAWGVAQVLRKFHFDGSATGNDSIVLHRSSNDHDGIVQGSFRLFHKLFRTTANNERARLGLRASSENVKPSKFETTSSASNENVKRKAQCSTFHHQSDALQSSGMCRAPSRSNPPPSWG